MNMSNDWNRRRFLGTSTALGATLLSGIVRGAEEPPLMPPDKQPPDLQLPEILTQRAGYAIVGLGKLALEEVMPAFAKCHLSRPAALVSGHPDKAKHVAQAYGMDPKRIYDYDNFDKIVDDEAVQVVYIILPNSMHCEFTLRALKAGKHVLCEKPMSVTSEEAERMIAAAKDAKRQLSVAYRLHYEPFNLKVMEMCANKPFGAIRTIASSNCQDVKAPNIRLSKKLGGGPVGDVGVYSINAARYITNEQPAEVTAYAQQPKDDPRFREVPASVAFTLKFPSGILAHCDCSFNASESRYYKIHCAKGTIEMDPSFSYRGLRLFTNEKGKRDEIRLDGVDHFAAEMDHFSGCVLDGKEPLTPGQEGLKDLKVMMAIYEAARSGKTVKLA
jgi:predicted dehydrogenase